MIEKDEVLYGKDFKVVLKVTNKGKDKRTLGGCLMTKSVYYTGVPYKVIKKERFRNEVISASKSKFCNLLNASFVTLKKHLQISVRLAYYEITANFLCNKYFQWIISLP